MFNGVFNAKLTIFIMPVENFFKKNHFSQNNFPLTYVIKTSTTLKQRQHEI